MQRFETIRRVAHTPRQMFNLVADVERYPEFVPLCEALKVVSREPTPAGEIIVADMRIGYKSLNERLKSCVETDRNDLSIYVTYLEGPISHLENRWQFEPTAEGGCEVHFFLEYEFRSLTFKLLMGTVFDRAFARFSQAFERRADLVYGSSAAPGEPAR